MKKNLFYAFAMFCSLSLLTTSCSKDDEGNGGKPLDVNASYKGESLDLTYSESILLGKVVTFNTTDGKTATLELKGELDLSSIMPTKDSPVVSMAPGVIPGEVTTTISNVTLKQDGEKYTFEGSDSQNGRTAEYKGQVEKGKLTLAINNIMPKNDFQGEWDLADVGVITVDWESGKGIILPGATEEWPVSSLAKLVPMLLDKPIKASLNSIIFFNSGNVVIDDYKNGENKTSPYNIAYYYMKNDKMYVQINIAMLLAVINQTKAGFDMGAIAQFLPLLSEGVPLSYNINGNNAQITLGKEILVPLMTFVLSNETITNLISNSIPEDLKPIAQGVIKQMPEILAQTTELSVSLNLKK